MKREKNRWEKWTTKRVNETKNLNLRERERERKRLKARGWCRDQEIKWDNSKKKTDDVNIENQSTLTTGYIANASKTQDISNRMFHNRNKLVPNWMSMHEPWIVQAHII